MRAGKLRHRITIQTASEAADSAGEPIKTWAASTSTSVISIVWASVEPLSGRELLQAQQVNAEVTHRVRLRYNSAVTPSMRFKVGTRYLDINSVMNPEERDAEMECLCTEVL